MIDPFAHHTAEHHVVVKGVRVNFRLDGEGKPLTIGTGWWVDDSRADEQREKAELAVLAIRGQLELAADKAAETARTATSTETRRDAAQNHPSIEWLEAALQAHQGKRALGAGNLAEAARRLFLWNNPKASLEERRKITVHRAREYLKATRRNKGKTPA